MQVLGKDATPNLTDLGNTGQSMTDPRGTQGIAARGKANFMGNTAMPGAGRPAGARLYFDPEILRRRLVENAASSRPTAIG